MNMDFQNDLTKIDTVLQADSFGRLPGEGDDVPVPVARDLLAADADRGVIGELDDYVAILDHVFDGAGAAAHHGYHFWQALWWKEMIKRFIILKLGIYFFIDLRFLFGQ